MPIDLQRYLDGELPRESLPPELAAEAEEWDRLMATAAELRGAGAPPWLESRVMAALPQTPALSWWQRGWRWLLEPHTIQLRPIGVALAGAVAVALLVVWQGVADESAGVPGLAQAGPANGSFVYVQFVLPAENAHTVALVGDFNGWDGRDHLLRDVNGDGVWTGLFALPPGLHKYMFVVDEEKWITDPRAERYVDDGFGTRNAVLAVVAPQRAS